MGVARLFGLCVALLFASSVTAANIIDLGPSDYRRWGEGTSHHHTNGLNRKFGQTIRIPPTNTNLTVTRNALVPYGSIANGAKNFLRVNPASIAASAAITGLFLAVDWVFDQASGEWVRMELTGEGEMEGGGWCLTASYGYCSNNNILRDSPLEACRTYGPYEVTSVDRVSDTEYRCNFEGGNTTVYRVGSPECLEGEYIPSMGICALPTPTPLLEQDWVNFENSLPSLPANQVGDGAYDIQRRIGSPLPGYTDIQMEGPSTISGGETTSTSTDPVTGDTVVTNTQTTTNISYGDTTITTTNTTTSTTYQNGQETNTTTITETPGELPVSVGGGGAGDWPGFCDWATVVCDWFNWTQEEPPPDLDLPEVIDDDFFEQKNISFGAKSCPPDHEINLAPFLPTTVGVSFQPLCDFAGIIYYMVMAASYIIAAYISIGVARSA